MATSSFILDILPLIDQSTGSREEYSFEVPLQFDELKLISPVSGKVEIMKIEEGFNAKVTDVKVKIEVTCQKCLEKFNDDIVIKMAERQYYMDPPADVFDPNDIYLVNKKDQSIDLAEFLRQEIILHFPLIPVHSKSCKGLCAVCGKNKNKESCNCKEEEVETHQPLAILKKLLKNK